MKLCGLIANSYMYVSVSYIFPGLVCLFGCRKIARMIMENGRQKNIIVFGKYQGRTVSFLGIHKSEPYIYIGFSVALHLQCSLH
jgi:hypothetical protein